MKFNFLELQLEQAEQIANWNEGKEDDFLMQWAGRAFHAPLTPEQILKDSNCVSEAVFSIYDKTDAVEPADMIGTIALITVDRQTSTGYIGHFLLNPSLTGHGVGTAVMHDFIQFCFENLQLKRLTLRVFAYNTPAVRCYEKNGYEIIERIKMDNGLEVWSMEVSRLEASGMEKFS